ncbi:unknown [Coprobacillus sp. CAG:605]|nr:unknown [Coprobacillus sp. CAG:605]
MTKSNGTKEDLVKIIRDDSLGNIWWGNAVNDWTQASLQTTLNGDYYNGTYKTGALKNDSTRNAIESVVWNLGGSSTYKDVTASMFYSRERGTTVYSGHATTWTGKVGLMYPSDYGYATAGGTTTNRAACLAKELYNWDGLSDCKNNDYLFKSSYRQWTLVSYSANAASVFDVDTDGYVGSYGAGTSNGVRPAAFLKSNILISEVGNGSSATPYQLSVK